MRTTLSIDDELPRKAMGLTGLMERSALVREGLKALIDRRVPGGWRGWAGASRSWGRCRDGGRTLFVGDDAPRPGLSYTPRSIALWSA